MKQALPLIILAALTIAAGLYLKRKFFDPKHRLSNSAKQVAKLSENHALRDGDLIFQTSLSGQSQAIQLATHSPYSHCGIIHRRGNDYFVFEAVEPVKWTALSKWIARGKEEHYVIKRLKNADQVLTPETLRKMAQVEDSFRNKHYDLYFDWSNEKMYCSELIWKVYKEATGLEVGKLEQLKDIDLSSKPVRVKLKERYGDTIPMDETVITPVSIFNSDLLTQVSFN
jgi:hypothetical protein